MKIIERINERQTKQIDCSTLLFLAYISLSLFLKFLWDSNPK